MAKTKSQVKGQMSLADFTREKQEALKKPIKRMARANAILEFIDRINYSNIKLGALGGFGETNPSFDFRRAHQKRIDYLVKHRRISTESAIKLTYKEVADDAARAAVQAELASKGACEVCEYAATCPRVGRIYEKLSSPDSLDLRIKLRTRMRAVIKSGGTKTMSCIAAAKSVRPKKADWDY